MTLVIVDLVVATAWTEGDSWQCDDEALCRFLDSEASQDRALEANNYYVPDMAIAMAELAVRLLPGARIVKVVDVDEQLPGVVY